MEEWRNVGSARPDPDSYEARQTLNRSQPKFKTRVAYSPDDDPAKVEFLAQLEKQRKRKATCR